jgi:hypothetical protein
MNVSVTVNREKERTYMKTFTIDSDNNITAFPTPDHAEAAVGAGSQPSTSQKQLAKLAAAWPAERLVEIWNSLPGVEPVKSFKSTRTAAARIWMGIQKLGENPEPKAPGKATSAKQKRRVAPSRPKSTRKTIPAKKAKAPKRAAKPKPDGVREGSKTAAVVALLERKGGATLAEVMQATSWQAHSVRGFISGTLGKKMRLTVTSTRREDGARVYSIGGEPGRA